jgi:undecaprenyl-diphosphatase
MMRIGIACVPAFVLGAILHKVIKERLFSPITVGVGFLAGGILVLLVERIWKRPVSQASETALDEITLRQAFVVGCGQCLALWPGMSRSASTIIGGMIAGLDRRTAAEFSFLVAVPVMIAATGLDLIKSASHIPSSAVPIFGVGFLVSFIVALGAIRWFISLLSRFTLVPFGWYRIVLGVITIIVYRA